MFSESTIQRRLRVLREDLERNVALLEVHQRRNSSEQIQNIFKSTICMLQSRIEELVWVLNKGGKK